VSVRRNARSMSTVATAQAPAKSPNTKNETATGRRLGVPGPDDVPESGGGGGLAGTLQSGTGVWRLPVRYASVRRPTIVTTA
jgi:hypothetical protein